jgi:ADP-heptose:LPS heptosyltransferase
MAILEKTLGKEVLPPESLDRASVRSILVIRQHDQLGDFLLSTPVLRALRQHFPSAKVGLVVREYFHEIARFVPYVDDVLVFRERLTRWSWKNGWSFFRGLRSGWDLAIVLNTVSHSLTSDLLAHFSGARYVLGSDSRVYRGSSRNFLYNLVAPDAGPGRHQTQRNLDIVRYIGVDTENYAPAVTLSDAERWTARRDLEALGFDADLPAIGLHLGAGKFANRWPVRSFADFARSLTGLSRTQIVLSWGAREEELRARFAECAGIRTVDVGHPDLPKLAASFAQCAAVVCNDTGIMHLAAASGVPVVAIFGPTNPDEWRPLGVRMIGLRAASQRTEDVGVEDVLEALRSLVGEQLLPLKA